MPSPGWVNSASVANKSGPGSVGVIQSYEHERVGAHHNYSWPVVREIVASLSFPEKRALDLGCGQGGGSIMLVDHFGFSVTGVDPSASGIALARKTYPLQSYYQLSTEDDLAAQLGTFPLVLSLEVICMVIDAKLFARRVFDLVAPGGVAIVSAPYHGYVKNLLLSLTNRWDNHMDPLNPLCWTRIFSEKTFRNLWHEAGFEDISIRRAGRIPIVANSMFAVLKKKN